MELSRVELAAAAGSKSLPGFSSGPHMTGESWENSCQRSEGKESGTTCNRFGGSEFEVHFGVSVGCSRYQDRNPNPDLRKNSCKEAGLK